MSRAFALGFSIAALLLATGGRTVSAAAADSGSGEVSLEEIVVTAQKRPERLQDVAISLSAFTAQDLRSRGVTRLDDLAGAVPNLHYNPRTSLRDVQIAVRGIVSDANSIGVDQAVGVYVDGVYMGRPTMINTGVYDIDRVEVLRGPQGTLYGRNTIAGALNLVTRLPGNEPGADGALTFGNYGAVLGYGALNLPLAPDRLALRISAQSEQRDGYFRNLAGPDLVDAKNLNGRVTLRYTPSDSLEMLFRADAARDRTHDGAVELAVVSPIFAAPPFNVVPGSPYYVPDDPYDRVIADNPAPYQNRDVWGGSLQVDWHMPSAATLTSISAYRGFDWENFQSADVSPFDISGSGITENQHQFSQEVRLASPSGERFEYVLGGYYYTMNLDAVPSVTLGEDFLSLPAFGGAPLGSFPGTVGRLMPALDEHSVAFFGQGTLRLGERFGVTGGLRYTNERKHITFSNSPDLVGIVPAITPAVKMAKRSDDVVTPMVNITFKPSEDALLYASFARGYKSGGYNAFDFDFANDDGSVPEYHPEFVNSYELGSKLEMLERRVRANLAVFYMDYSDLQVNLRLPSASGLFVLQTSNAAKARSKGVELDFAASLAKGLDLSGGYGYTDATYLDYVPNAQTGLDYSGNRLAGAPKNSISASLQYERPIGTTWKVQTRADYSRRGDVFSDPANTGVLKNDAYGLLDARLGFARLDSKLEIILWGKNVLDKDYTLNRQAGSAAFGPGSFGYYPGPPRTYGITLRATY